MIQDIRTVMMSAARKQASDIFIAAGLPLSFKLQDRLTPQASEPLTTEESSQMVNALYAIIGRSLVELEEYGDDDFSITVDGVARYRVCAYKQRGTVAAVVRLIPLGIPDYKALHIPDAVMKLADLESGLVLVTGTAGCGKSTTLACLIDRINRTQHKHIITLEDPVEFVHQNKCCAVSQREIGLDSNDYGRALRAALRQAPDVLLLGEIRDYETIRTAITAAETGHLVLASLHTISAIDSVDRIIDVFPEDQQPQIRIQIPQILKAIVSQQLIPSVNGRTMMPAFEVVLMTNAIRSVIRENQAFQMNSFIQDNNPEGVIRMDTSLLNLYKEGHISETSAIAKSRNVEQMTKRIKDYNIELAGGTASKKGFWG